MQSKEAPGESTENEFFSAAEMVVIHTDITTEADEYYMNQEVDAENSNMQFMKKILQSESKGNTEISGQGMNGLNIRIVAEDIEETEKDVDEARNNVVASMELLLGEKDVDEARNNVVGSTELLVGEIDVDEARNNVVASMELLGESNASLTSGKAATMSDEMKAQLADSLMKLDLSVNNRMLVESLCTVTDGNPRPGNLPCNIGVRIEQNPKGAGIPDVFLKSCFSTLLHTVSLADATVLPASTLFQNTFKDSQKIQLYAQILVYASLVQISVPGQALMEAAFGHNKGDGNKLWEKAWCIAAERFQRKEPSNTLEMLTPTTGSSVLLASTLKIEIGLKNPSQCPEQNVSDSMGFSHLETRLSDKGDHPISGGTMNEISLPCSACLSPLVWEILSPAAVGFGVSHMASSQNYCQNTERHYVVSKNGNHFLRSEPISFSHFSFPGRWIENSQAMPFGSSLPISSTAEPQITWDTPYTRELSAASCIPDVTLAQILLPCSQTARGCIDYAGENVNADAQNEDINVKRKLNGKHPSGKRMKNHLYGEVNETGDLIPLGIEEKIAPNFNAKPFVADTGEQINGLLEIVSIRSPIGSVYHNQTTPTATEKRGIFGVEENSSLENTKLNAEEAALTAATAVKHIKDIWSQLCSKRNSGLISDCEAVLASSADAADAAISIAKAATDAAKAAYQATVRAKFIAGEILSSDISTNVNKSDHLGSDAGSTGKETCIIGPKVKEKDTGSNPQIGSVCQTIDVVNTLAFEPRFESAPSSTKNGQDLRTILETANLVAEAVSLIKTVIDIGDPSTMSLNTLSEAGSEVHFKQLSSEAQTSETFNNCRDRVHSSQKKASKASEQSVYIMKPNVHIRVYKDEMPIKTKDNFQNAVQFSPKKDTQPSEELGKLLKTDDHRKFCNEGPPAEANEALKTSEGSLISWLQTSLSDELNCDVLQMQKEAKIQTNLFSSEVKDGTQGEVTITETDHSIIIQNKVLVPKINNIKEVLHMEVLSKEVLQMKVCKQGQPGEKNEVLKTFEDSSIPQIQTIQMRKEVELQTNFSSCDVEADPQGEVTITEMDHGLGVQNKTVVPKMNKITEGSHVEVLSKEGLQRAWFSAQVLCLNEDKALIRHDRLHSDAIPNHRQEWILLNGESGGNPRIRLLHPTNATKHVGTRKRQRAAMGKNDWVVGDQVDAWIGDGWWEGIVIGKSTDYEDELIVHNTGGKNFFIKSWNLRPSLVWMDGRWIECSGPSTRENVGTKNDLNCSKRRKLDKDVTLRETIDVGKSQEITNLESSVKVQKPNVMVQSENKPPASPAESLSSSMKKKDLMVLAKGASLKALGVSRLENKTKFSFVNKTCNTSKIPKNLPARRFTGQSVANKAPVQSQNQTRQRNNKTRPRIPKPKDSKLRNTQATNESKTVNDTFPAIPKTTATSGHDFNMESSSKASKNCSSGGDQSGVQQPSSAQCFPVSKETMIPRPPGCTKVKSSPFKHSQEESKEKLPFNSYNPVQNSKKSNVYDHTKKRHMLKK